MAEEETSPARQDSSIQVQPTAFQPVYRYPAVWGGEVISNKEPTVAADLNKLRKLVGSLAARKKDGVKFKVKASSELYEKLQPALDKLKMLATVPDLQVTHAAIDGGSMVTITARVRFSAADGSFIDSMACGMGVDSQDKAGGKANTYAYKAAVIMALQLPEVDSLPDADDEGEPVKGGVTRITLEKALEELKGWDAKTIAEKSPGVQEVLKGRDPADAVAFRKAAGDRYKGLLAAAAQEKKPDGAA